MSKHKRSKNFKVPNWLSAAYIFMALVLSPWIIYLAYSLPTRHLSSNYDTSWVGLDVGIIFSILFTGLFAKTKSKLLTLSATMTATFLLVDAWFDVSTSSKGTELSEAVILAIFIELPVAILSLALAYKTLQGVE